MYSPFIDEKGIGKTIDQVQYEDLLSLKDFSEGYHLEFKREIEESQKHNIAKAIAAFSNCEGGWLFIGIDDHKNIYPIDEIDYGQKIGKIVMRVSPLPEFETKFIRDPKCDSKGVLVVYVYEGRNAPYICDGSIYVRCGSNKEPVTCANRGNVEYLIQKTKGFIQQLDDFCKRDYYFEINHEIPKNSTQIPFVSIFLKNVRSKDDNRLYNYKNRQDFIQYIRNVNNIFHYTQYSMNSIVFTSEFIYPGKASITPILEVYYDWSCKIYCPIAISNMNEIIKAKEYFSAFVLEDDIDCLKVFNAGIIFNSIWALLIYIDKMAEKYELKEKDYVLNVEMENIGNNILYFENGKYKEYIEKQGGIPFAIKNRIKSKYIDLCEYSQITFSDLPIVVIGDCVGPAFGFEHDAIIELIDNENLKYGYIQDI